MITLRLPLPPSSNNLFGTGRNRRRHATDAYEAWREEAGYRLNRQAPGRILGPVSVAATFAENKGDLDNRAKAMLDLLVEHRVIEDDNSKIVRRITLEWSSDIEGCVVKVTPWGTNAPTG